MNLKRGIMLLKDTIENKMTPNKFRRRILKKWKRKFKSDLYNSAYEQGRFDVYMEQEINKR